MSRYAPDVRLLAGGTDLFVDLKTGRLRVSHLVSLRRVSRVSGLTVTDGTLRIGALTTISQLDRDPRVRTDFHPILDATRQMAVRQIRNVATVGGNIASAVPCADLPPILTVMNATVTLWSPSGERTLPLESFFLGLRRTALGEGEILTDVQVPPLPVRFGAAYARFALREGNAIAVAGVAAGLLLNDDDTIRDARIALGAVAPTPIMVDAAREALLGKPLDDETIAQAAGAAMQAARPISDVRGSAGFRRELVGVLTHRALATARQRAMEGTPC